MAAFADAFKAEVMRMARKEIKGEVVSLRKAVAAHRSEIAALKRDLKGLSAQLNIQGKMGTGKPRPVQAGKSKKTETQPTEERKSKKHFRHEALVAKRESLGISREAMAALLGASKLSVGRWESGKVMPRAAQLESIQAVMKMGKRAALAQLVNLSRE